MEDELKWAIQNGDMQKVKDIIEVEVKQFIYQ